MNNRVKELRTERGLSQQQLGEAMEVSRQTINSIEKERYTPSLPLAIALARYFDRSGGVAADREGGEHHGAEREGDAGQPPAAADDAVSGRHGRSPRYEIADGQDREPYSQLGAIAGVAYVIALIAGRLRG